MQRNKEIGLFTKPSTNRFISFGDQQGDRTIGNLFYKYYSPLFLILALNPFVFHLLKMESGGMQPYLFIPILIALCLMVWPALQGLTMGALQPFSVPVRLLWGTLLIWAGFMTIHKLQLSIPAIRYVFGHPYGVGAWLAPVMMLAGGQPEFWRKIIQLFFRHTRIACVLGLIFIISLLGGFQVKPPLVKPNYAIFNHESAASFFYAAGFLCIVFPLGFIRQRLWAISGVLFLFTVNGFLVAMRNQMFKYANYILFFCFHWFMSAKEKFPFQKLIVIYLFVLMMVTATFYLFYSDNPVILNEATQAFREKVQSNSRQDLLMYFGYYMKGQNAFSILAGNGIWGKWGQYQGGRLHIEQGFAHMLVKGGLVMLVPFLLLSGRAVIAGIFMRGNWFIQGCGIYVFLRLLDMIPYGLPEFEGNYLIYWLCIGACLSRKMRNMQPNIFFSK